MFALVVLVFCLAGWGLSQLPWEKAANFLSGAVLLLTAFVVLVSTQSKVPDWEILTALGIWVGAVYLSA